MKQLYIHIGTHKTGSTLLQRFLASNESHLLKQRVLYPRFCRKDNDHNPLLVEFCPKLGQMLVKHYDDEQIKSLKNHFDSEVENSGAEKIIISSEDFSRPLEPYHWKLVKTLSSGYETFIIIYLRRQSEFVISNYNWGIKTELHLKETLANALNNGVYLKDYLGNYETALLKWSEIVGDDNIIVNPYEGNVRQNIIPSFLQSVGIDQSDEMITPDQRAHTSICNTFLKLKYFANCSVKEYFRVDFGYLSKLSERLTTLRQHENRLTKDPTPISPKKQRELIEQFTPMNNRIAKKYLKREKLFLSPLPSDDIPFNEDMALSNQEINDVSAVFLLSIMEMNAKLNSLQNQINQLKNQNQALQNRYNDLSWVRLFNIKKILHFLKRKLLLFLTKLKSSRTSS